MKRLGLIVFSIAYWTVAFFWMGFLAVATILASGVFGYPRVHRWIPAPGFYGCVRMGFVRMKITYDPAFDPWRLSVFCQNHVNFLDAHLASSAIPHAFCGLMHAWQFHIPFYGWLMRVSKGIRVYPGKKNLESLVVQARERKRIRMSILTFPEGGRTTTGKVREFRKGVFAMAREAGYPVVPISVRGAYAVNRKGSMLFHPFHTIEIHIGRQFETQGLDDSGLEALVREVQEEVARYADAE